MKSHIYRMIAIVGIFFGLAVVSVHGQTPSRVEVKIPFEFTAGKAKFKPGVYTIKRLSGNLLRLGSKDGKLAVILNAPSTLTSADPKSVERLVFNRYEDDRYLLTQIWLSVDSGCQVFTETRAEKSERVELSLRREE